MFKRETGNGSEKERESERAKLAAGELITGGLGERTERKVSFNRRRTSVNNGSEALKFNLISSLANSRRGKGQHWLPLPLLTLY